MGNSSGARIPRRSSFRSFALCLFRLGRCELFLDFRISSPRLLGGGISGSGMLLYNYVIIPFTQPNMPCNQQGLANPST